MPHQIGYSEPAGTKLAHQVFVETVMDFASVNGWQVMRFDDSGVKHELIMMAPGMSGTEQIYIGLRTYDNINADYYNILAAVFTGYVAGNTFDTQPGAVFSGVPAHNRRIDYWLTLNGQRLAFALKVETPVYETCYLGKMLPYARPSQYPYPVVLAGMLAGEAAVRFDNSGTTMPFKGNRANLQLRGNDGWRQPYAHPWSNRVLSGSGDDGGGNYGQLRDTGGSYPLLPIELHDNTANLWGALDGVYYISGFNNGVENTLTIDGVDYVVIQDAWRTGHADYVALRMDI